MITVVLASYNGEKYIEEQIKSILKQNIDGLEILIIDDNSSDKTRDIVAVFCQKYKNISLIKNESQLGVVKNFEKGISLAQKPYVALSDQDDVWYDNKLKIQLNLLKKHEVIGKPILVHSDLCIVDQNLNPLKSSFFAYRHIDLPAKNALNKIISHNGVMGCTILMNKALIEKALPFPEDLEMHDYWLALVAEISGKRITIPNPLVYYRLHENNTSNTQTKMIKAHRSFLRSIINDDKLPFLGKKREIVLKEFITRYCLEKNNLKIVYAFIDYLEESKKSWEVIYKLIKYNLIRNDIRYRIKIFIKILMNGNKLNFSSSQQLIKNTKGFLNIQNYSFVNHLFGHIGTFYGWGRKSSGKSAVNLAEKFGTSYRLLEDGFIRSVGLGVENSPSFSIVEDDIGIYYDATAPSRLENILNNDNLKSDIELIKMAKMAIGLIRKHQISKYNNAIDVPENFFSDDGKRRILIIAQTAGDASLSYGLGDKFSTDEIIDAAIEENPDALIYLKIHPDVLSGKKKSDIDIEDIEKKCIIINQNFNPISLLKYFDTVYTKTSQMGFEALLLGKQCVCFGIPFYAGWGVTDDRILCERRIRKRTISEIFAAAYILYTKYYNPYQSRSSDILDTIYEIIKQKRIQSNRPKNDSKHRILVIGDSHIRVFEHPWFSNFFPNTEFKIVYVSGATAGGVRNINSRSQACRTFKCVLEDGGYDEIIVTLGEVDAAYAIWKRAEAHNSEIEVILEDVITKYQEFIVSLQRYAPTFVISAPLQTIADCRGCNDETSQVRSGIDISIQDRTALSVEFNRRIKMFCDEQMIIYLDFDSWSLGKNGVVKTWLIHPNNPCDHHYYRWRYAMMIILKMIMRKFRV